MLQRALPRYEQRLPSLGYVLSGSDLHTSDGGCRLYVGNYDGGAAVELLRTCDDPAYSALFTSLL